MKNALSGIFVAIALVAVICSAPSDLFSAIRKAPSTRSAPSSDHSRSTRTELPETPISAMPAGQYRLFVGEEGETASPRPNPVSVASLVLPIPASPSAAKESFAKSSPAAPSIPGFSNLPPAFGTASTAGVVPVALAASGLTPLEPIPDRAMASMASPASITDYITERDIIGEALPRTQVANIPAPARPSSSWSVGTFSSSAFASLSDGGVPMKAICPTSVCSDPPPKGLTLRAYGQTFKEKQKAGWSNGYNSAYETSGKMAGIGFLKDWSVATTIGLSVDYLDAEVESSWVNDTRKNDVSGYLFNAHLQTSFMDKYPVEGKLIYGNLNTTGEGALTDPVSGESWNLKERKHRSKLFGFSGKVGIPLVLGDDIKLEPDAGFQFLRLQSDAYDIDLYNNADSRSYSYGKTSATSISVPLTLNFKREMTQCFGTFTPRLNIGLIKEFSDSAMAVRTFNASAASQFGYDIDDSPRTFYKAGAGMSLTTVGGWNVNGDFSYYWHGRDKYKNSVFTLEAGRCF